MAVFDRIGPLECLIRPLVASPAAKVVGLRNVNKMSRMVVRWSVSAPADLRTIFGPWPGRITLPLVARLGSKVAKVASDRLRPLTSRWWRLVARLVALRFHATGGGDGSGSGSGPAGVPGDPIGGSVRQGGGDDFRFPSAASRSRRESLQLCRQALRDPSAAATARLW